MSNIIDAVLNMVNYKNNTLLTNSHGNNRANNAGDGLEEFVKDMFAGTFNKRLCPPKVLFQAKMH